MPTLRERFFTKKKKPPITFAENMQRADNMQQSETPKTSSFWDRFTRKNQTDGNPKKTLRQRVSEFRKRIFNKKDDDAAMVEPDTTAVQEKQHAEIRQNIKELETKTPTNITTSTWKPELFESHVRDNNIEKLTNLLLTEENYKNENITFFPIDDLENCAELYELARRVLNPSSNVFNNPEFNGKQLQTRSKLALAVLDAKYKHLPKTRGGRKTRCGKKRKGGRRHKKRHLTRKR
jgi:hypothetical protein